MTAINIASVKPYQTIPIQDCGEPLIAIPLTIFALETPHPYQKLGADYGTQSPYYLRQGVIEALNNAQINLQRYCPDWRILIFDAYRPVSVQQFMVDHTFAAVLKQNNLKQQDLSAQHCQEIWQQVYQIWAIPSDNINTPPPHSTGAAIDITLIDTIGNLINMGGEIDELNERSQPNYYANSTTEPERTYHTNREILNKSMIEAGFRRHPGEWWHFSLGDQMWAWLYNQEHPEQPVIARYGRFF